MLCARPRAVWDCRTTQSRGCWAVAVAVKHLEAGRSVFRSQSLDLQTDPDDLRISDPALAAKLMELSQKLEKSSFRDIHRNNDPLWPTKALKNCANLYPV